MNYIKQNKKQLLTIAVLLIILVLSKVTGVDSLLTSFNEIYSETTGIADAKDPSDEVYSDTKDVSDVDSQDEMVDITYTFRNDGLLKEHFEKHGEEFPYSTKEEYLEGANIMLANPDKLHKVEKEDGDDVYYLESTNEFIVVSKDGYLRTYFKPSKGRKYFDRQ